MSRSRKKKRAKREELAAQMGVAAADVDSKLLERERFSKVRFRVEGLNGTRPASVFASPPSASLHVGVWVVDHQGLRSIFVHTTDLGVVPKKAQAQPIDEDIYLLRSAPRKPTTPGQRDSSWGCTRDVRRRGRLGVAKRSALRAADDNAPEWRRQRLAPLRHRRRAPNQRDGHACVSGPTLWRRPRLFA